MNITSPPSPVSLGFRLFNFPKQVLHQRSHLPRWLQRTWEEVAQFPLPLFFTTEWWSSLEEIRLHHGSDAMIINNKAWLYWNTLAHWLTLILYIFSSIDYPKVINESCSVTKTQITIVSKLEIQIDTWQVPWQHKNPVLAPDASSLSSSPFLQVPHSQSSNKLTPWLGTEASHSALCITPQESSQFFWMSPCPPNSFCCFIIVLSWWAGHISLTGLMFSCHCWPLSRLGAPGGSTSVFSTLHP